MSTNETISKYQDYLKKLKKKYPIATGLTEAAVSGISQAYQTATTQPYGKQALYWQNKMSEYNKAAMTPVDTPLLLKDQPKGFWSQMTSLLMYPIEFTRSLIQTGGPNGTGEYTPSVPLEMPDTTAKRQMAQTESAVKGIAESKFMSEFYTYYPILREVKDIRTYSDYFKSLNIQQPDYLTLDDFAEMQSTINAHIGTAALPPAETDIPEFMEVEPGEEAAVREFIEQPTPQAIPVNINQMTIEEIKSSLMTPWTAQRPDMTEEEMAKVASLMDIPEDVANSAMDISEMAEMLSQAAQESQVQVAEVLAGIRDWEAPKLSTWQRILFIAQQPMQAASDIMQPYLKNISYPLAGGASYLVSKVIGGEQSIEKKYNEYRAAGKNPWESLSAGWETAEYPWWQKLLIELPTDPLTWIPGLGLSVPGKVLLKMGATRAGLTLLRVNEGMYYVMDIIPSIAKTLWTKLPKSFDQAITHKLNEFMQNTLYPAISLHTGKPIHQLTVDDVSKTLTEAVKAFADNPKGTSKLTELGAKLAEFKALTKNEVSLWAKSRASMSAPKGTIPAEIVVNDVKAAEVNGIIRDNLLKVGSPAENAKRLSTALGLNDTSEVLSRLIKDMDQYVARRSTNVTQAISIGKKSPVGGVSQMFDYLKTKQLAIIKSNVTGAVANGSFMQGVILGMQHGLDKVQNHALRVTIDRFMVRPLAEAYLGNISYPFWNALEGLAISTIEGVVPGFTKRYNLLTVTKGLIGLPADIMEWAASEPAGMLGKRGRAITLLPSGSFGKWFGREWVNLSNEWGNSIRANFIVRRMDKYLTEALYDVQGKNVMKSFDDIIGDVPKIAKERLGLTQDELKNTVNRLLAAGDLDGIKSLKSSLTNLSLMQKEVEKVVQKYNLIPPRAKQLIQEASEQGQLLASEQSILDNTMKASDQALADLRDYSTDVMDSFRTMADDVTGMEIDSLDTLMNVYQSLEVMSLTDSIVPSRMTAETFRKADALYNARKFKDVEELWLSDRQKMLETMDSLNDSMERVREKLTANLKGLTPDQQLAMDEVLRRADSAIKLRESYMKADGQLLDDFWALPKTQRTSAEHSAFRAYRMENWLQYSHEAAELGAGEMLSRKEFAKLYQHLPEPQLQAVDASARALTPDDIAKVMGCNIDALSSGITENMVMQDKDMFVQYILKSADSRPELFRGFTQDKIEEAYDRILRGIHMRPDMDISTQKILQQVEGMKQDLINLRMVKSLKPDEEKKLAGWIDDVTNRADNEMFTPVRKTPYGVQQPPDDTARKFWDENLEYNNLRTKPENRTDAAGFIAVKLENAGDILREMGKDFSDMGYISEKIRKIRMEINVSDWTAKLSGTEANELRKIRELVTNIPEATDATKSIKSLLLAITERDTKAVKTSLDTVESLLKAKVPRTLKPEYQPISTLRQTALDSSLKDYYKVFADYTNPNIIDTSMKMVYPFWTYSLYRWFMLPRLALKHPGLMVAWGKYYNYSDQGYVHIPGTDLEINPFVGSMFGTTFALARHDYVSYYSSLGVVGELLDTSQRMSFFPGPQLMLPIVMTPIFTGKSPELGSSLPAIGRFGLDLLRVSNIPGVKSTAEWLQSKVFHDNLRDYYTTTIISTKQVESGGKLIDGQSGIDLWYKRLRNEELTEEEQALWDEATRETSLYNLLRAQFPQFRLRTEEYLEAYKQVTKLFEEQLGMSEEFQDNLWKHNMRPSDVVALPLDLQQALDEMWQWRIYFGRGQTMMPPEVQDLYALRDEYWDKVKTYQSDRLTSQATNDTGFLTPTDTNHLSGSEWREQRASTWATYSANTDALDTDPHFADAVESFTPEGQVSLMKRLGYMVAPEGPMDEAINLYFSVTLGKRKDDYTGDEDYDYLKFWLEREAVRMSLSDDLRSDFDAVVRKYESPTETVFRNAYNTYIRGYHAISRILIEDYSDEEKALIAEFYSDDVTTERKEQIRALTSEKSGLQLISDWTTRLSRARSAWRTANPKTDYWLNVFGYVDSTKTPESRAMVDAFDNNRSSILQ